MTTMDANRDERRSMSLTRYKPSNDTLVFQVVTKKQMLYQPHLAFSLFCDAIEALGLEYGTPSELYLLSRDERQLNFDFSPAGLASMQEALANNLAAKVELLYGAENGRGLPTGCQAQVSWLIDPAQQYVDDQPYQEESCDLFMFSVSRESYEVLPDCDRLGELLVKASVSLDAAHAYAGTGVFPYATEHEYMFGLGGNNLAMALAYAGQYVRGWFWANVLSSAHIQKLGGIQAVMEHAPFEVVWALQSDDGNDLVYLQLPGEITSVSPADLQKATDYLQPLFYPKDVVFGIRNDSESVFYSKPAAGSSVHEMPTYTVEELDLLTGLSESERLEWDRQKAALYQSGQGAEASTQRLAGNEDLCELLKAALQAKIDGWVQKSDADYFDIEAMQELYRALVEKTAAELDRLLSLNSGSPVTEEEKADVFGFAVGYLDNSLNL